MRCRYREKEQLTQREARDRAMALNRKRVDVGSRSVQAYRCDGHWHVGHKPSRKHRKHR
jgi:hypothetical protein